MTTDPSKIAAPGVAHAPVERPTTGDASPDAPQRVASPVVTFRPSASPVAQMVQCQAEPSAGELHAFYLRKADEYRRLARNAHRRRDREHEDEWNTLAKSAAARAYSYAVQAERAEKAGGL